MTEFGLCLWTFGDLTLEEKCKRAKEIGVDGVEVQGDLSVKPSEVKEVLKKYGLKALSVTPDNVDISSTNEKIRNEAVDYFIKLVDWAKEVGADRFCLHGEVGVTALDTTYEEHYQLLLDSTKKIVDKAASVKMPVVYEVLNRYENYIMLTAKEAKRLVKDVGNSYLTILLDAYHMNIEEADTLKALETAGADLGVYHIADSNRQGIGNGHSNLLEQLDKLKELNYTGPVIMEMSAAGPNPFTPVKEGDYLAVLTEYYSSSLEILKKRFN